VADPSPVPGPVSQTSQDALTDAINLCRSESNRWQRADPRTSEHWAAVAADLEWLRQERALRHAVEITKPLRDKELEAERITSGFMEMRLDASGAALQQAQATIQRLEQDVKRGTERWYQQDHRIRELEAKLTAAQATIPHLQALVDELDFVIRPHRKGDIAIDLTILRRWRAALLSAIPAPREETPDA
jgi:chromosome segregation ATPase